MSDHSHSNIYRNDSTSGRGLLIAFVLIVAFIVLLAFVGSFAGDESSLGENAITPAEESTTAPTLEVAPVPTE